MEKMAQFCQNLRIFSLDCQNFMITYNSNGQIWVFFPPPHIDCRFGYITKLRKETPVIQRLLPLGFCSTGGTMIVDFKENNIKSED